MSQLPLDYQENVKAAVEAIKTHFPFNYGNRQLVLEKVTAGKARDPDDLNAQKAVKISGRKWGHPIHGTVALYDKGKLLDRQKILFTNVPVPTRRFSYIVNHSDYYPLHQNRLKPGIYTRKRASGETETMLNLSKGHNFHLVYAPEKKQYTLQFRNTNVPLYHVMKALGAKDSELAATWGSEVLAASRKPRSKLRELARTATGEEGLSEDAAAEKVREVFGKMEISTPETSELTIGLKTSKITVPSLLLASRKLRQVSIGEESADNRDSLEYRWILGMPEFVRERIERSDFPRNIRRRITKHDNVKSILGSGSFDKDVWAVFTSAGLADRAPQTNPIAEIMAIRRASILGEGGVGNVEAITEQARQVHPSFLGVFDPIATPESEKAGAVYPLASGVVIKDKQPWLQLRTKGGKDTTLPFSETFKKVVALEDEVDFAKSSRRKVRAFHRGKIVEVPTSKVDYTIDPDRTFSVATRLIPFLSANDANRVEITYRFLGQAIGLQRPEQPLVQVKGYRGSTVEEALGNAVVMKSPVDGVVQSVGPTRIKVKSKGKAHTVHVPFMFPLNDGRSFEHHRPLVKKGDRVTEGQQLTESNFTDNGVLAFGVNSRVAYIPDGGYNFEDGVTVSESFAKKMTSTALVQKLYEEDADVGLEKYHRSVGPVAKEVRENYESGVIKPGTLVRKGDILIAAVRSRPLTKEEKLLAKSKAEVVKLQDASLYWDQDLPGVVKEAVDTGRGVYLSVAVEEPLHVGDKVSNRHGGKGVVSRILPDEAMPKTADGVHMEVLISPQSLGGRMSLGQVYETLTGKVAEKNNEVIEVPSFHGDDWRTGRKIVEVEGHYRTYYVGPDKTPVKRFIKSYKYERDYAQQVRELLHRNGVEAEEPLYDSKGKLLGNVLLGNQYMLKLIQQAEHKRSVRGEGHPYLYSTDRTPIKGTENIGEIEAEAAQAMDRYAIQGLLAHGATHTVRDALTYKGDRDNDEVWTAIQMGATLPPPRVPFVNKKFEAYLQGLGLELTRDGDEASILPMTNKEILGLSNGEIYRPTFFSGKTGKAAPGELFDQKITGGLDGEGWGHVRLPVHLLNPVFVKPAASILGVTQKQMIAVAGGQKFLHEGDKGYEVTDDARGAIALSKALGAIDVKREFKAERDTNRKKYLRALDEMDAKADIYMLQNVPVIPPVFRPIMPLKDRVLYADLNLLYSDLINTKDVYLRIKKETPELLLEAEGRDLKAKMFADLANLYGTAGTSEHNREAKGILKQLHGSVSKYGVIQHQLLRRRQDLSARAVIVPGPELNIDEVGMPAKIALEIYKPFVVRELGIPPLRARDLISDSPEDPIVRQALEKVVSERPVWFKRDPVLHKFGMMAVYPRLSEGDVFRLHPLLTSAYGADFDGDQMSAFVPVSDESVREAMDSLPSRLIKSPATGKYIHQPTQEALVGLYEMTKVTRPKTVRRFTTFQDARDAVTNGDVKMTDMVSVGKFRTTVGRAMFAAALPEDMRGELDLKKPDVDKKRLGELLQKVGDEHPGRYGKVVDKIRKLGFDYSYRSGFSYKMSDFYTNRNMRKKYLAEFKKRATGKNDKVRAAIGESILTKMDNETYPATNTFVKMNKSGVKPPKAGIQKMLVSPLIATWGDQTLPVYTSLAEGMNSMDYWAMTPSARTGVVSAVRSVRLPGDLTKQMMAASMNMVVSTNDCGADGVLRPPEEAIDRFLSNSVGPYKKGNVVTPEMVRFFKRQGVRRVPVRSPLSCQEGEGLCSKCYGMTEYGPAQVGDNVGVTAAHSMGERGTQLALKAKHTGTLRGMPPISKVSTIIRMPEKMPMKAVISRLPGTVSGVASKKDGKYVTVRHGDASKDYFVPHDRDVVVKKGEKVKAAQMLSSGLVDPREVLASTKSLSAAQNSIVDGLASIYGPLGIDKRHMEVLARSMTNLARVDDPGDSSYIKGDMVPYHRAQAWKRKNKGSGLRLSPVLKGVTSLPQYRDDWASALGYRGVKKLLMEAAATGAKSKVHGLHPTGPMLFPEEFGEPRREGGAKY